MVARSQVISVFICWSMMWYLELGIDVSNLSFSQLLLQECVCVKHKWNHGGLEPNRMGFAEFDGFGILIIEGYGGLELPLYILDRPWKCLFFFVCVCVWRWGNVLIFLCMIVYLICILVAMFMLSPRFK